MRVLWISSAPIGPAAEILGCDYQGTSGGWIRTEYEKLRACEMQLGFLTVLPDVPSGQYRKEERGGEPAYAVRTPRILYGCRPGRALTGAMERAIRDFRPDLIQIWGTETVIAVAGAMAAPNIPKVIFQQGIIGIHARYKKTCFQPAAQDHGAAMKRFAYQQLRERVKEELFRRQIAWEQTAIRTCGNVILDSEFAEAYCRSLSPDIRCFRYQLLPNARFIDGKWSYEGCERHTIFTIAATTPMKGLQQLLRALALVRREFPDVKLFVPGNFGLHNGAPSGAFETWIADFLQKNDLADRVSFIGRQNVDGMVAQLERANVFVSPSCMEVHALSLREAMSVGVPCVSSVCGSVQEFVEHGRSGLLYRYEEYEVLAREIMALFRDPERAQRLGACAAQRWQRDAAASLEPVYQTILKKEQAETT